MLVGGVEDSEAISDELDVLDNQRVCINKRRLERNGSQRGNSELRGTRNKTRLRNNSHGNPYDCYRISELSVCNNPRPSCQTRILVSG